MVTPMSLPATSVTASFQLGPKGRVVLPVAIRRAAHIEEGATVVAHVLGRGRIVIETVDAIRSEVWGSVPTGGVTAATADVRDMRTGDARIADAAANRRSDSGAGTSDDAGTSLLRHLGL